MEKNGSLAYSRQVYGCNPSNTKQHLIQQIPTTYPSPTPRDGAVPYVAVAHWSDDLIAVAPPLQVELNASYLSNLNNYATARSPRVRDPQASGTAGSAIIVADTHTPLKRVNIGGVSAK
jgi:hypothetical protein